MRPVKSCQICGGRVTDRRRATCKGAACIAEFRERSAARWRRYNDARLKSLQVGRAERMDAAWEMLLRGELPAPDAPRSAAQEECIARQGFCGGVWPCPYLPQALGLESLVACQVRSTKAVRRELAKRDLARLKAELWPGGR
jgi:hypothetical protein